MGKGLLVAAVLGTAAAKKSGNMNGKYIIASGSQEDPYKNVGFNDDYGSKGDEYFDVYGVELATHYGDVYWTDSGSIPLPDHIVERFKGKVMAITGYEQDQVMVSPVGKPGENPAKDVSVPINWAYNHHYMAWITGSHSEMHKMPADPDGMGHGSDFMMMARDSPSASEREDVSIPTSQMFSEGNGGESRKSFHGYPNGYAQLIDSPNSWHLTPMQIDTRNRECGVTPADVHNCTKMNPGIEPRQARYGFGTPKDTNYSGLLECPCNGRFGGDPSFYPDTKTKSVTHDFFTMDTGVCQRNENVHTAEACFAAAPTLGINATRFNNKTISDDKSPPGCSVMPQSDGSVSVFYNSIGTGTCHGTKRSSGDALGDDIGVKLGLDLDGSSLFKRSKMGLYCDNNRHGMLKTFKAESTSSEDAFVALDQCEKWCWLDNSCWGCSIDCQSLPGAYGILSTGCQFNAITSCGKEVGWAGSIPGDVSIKQQEGGVAKITVSGPADVWFGVGIHAKEMADQPYTFIVNDKGVQEQKLGTCGSEADHCPGDTLATSVKLLSNTVSNGRRTVVMTRSFKGLTPKHYTFGLDHTTIPLIMAVGRSQVFAYHKIHQQSQISLTSVGTFTCVCDRAVGDLCENDGTGCMNFVKNCAPPGQGDLITQKNPTCNSRQYAGGLRCCIHKHNLLDHDQEIPPEILRYHHKFRFWFQEYTPAVGNQKASHLDLPRVYYQTESWAGEYDIPPAFRRPGIPIPGYPNWPLNTPTPGTTCKGTCPDGPDCECLHTITFRWAMNEDTRLVYAGGHCHAPSCVRLDLYRNDTGTPKLLCRQEPLFGQGNVHIDKYDEAGYIHIPPCLWSDDPAEGLQPTEWLPRGTPMFSISQKKNTHLGHYGEMASWQMRGANAPPLRRDVTFV